MSDGRPSSLVSLLRLTQPHFRDILMNPNLFGDNSNSEINEMISHSILSGSFSQPPLPPPIANGVLGDCTFFANHSRNVKGVDFSPIEDHLFCSAGLDGKLVVYDARFAQLKSNNQLTFYGTISFNGLKFLKDGYRVALPTTSNKLLIYDLEKEIILQHFDKCCASLSSKIPIATDGSGLIMTPNLQGTGITQIDIRTPSVIKNMDHIHTHHITDIELLDSQWSSYYHNNYGRGVGGSGNLIMTSGDNFCKIIDSQKNVIKEYQTRQPLNSATHPPEFPNSLNSCITVGGTERLSFYSLDGQNVETLPFKGISKLKYTKSSNKLFAACSDGSLKLFNRSKKKHDFVGEVYKHSRDIYDISISRNDEYIVTASNDNKVGLIRIGEPLFGPSETGNII